MVREKLLKEYLFFLTKKKKCGKIVCGLLFYFLIVNHLKY